MTCEGSADNGKVALIGERHRFPRLTINVAQADYCRTKKPRDAARFNLSFENEAETSTRRRLKEAELVGLIKSLISKEVSKVSRQVQAENRQRAQLKAIELRVAKHKLAAAKRHLANAKKA